MQFDLPRQHNCIEHRAWLFKVISVSAVPAETLRPALIQQSGPDCKPGTQGPPPSVTLLTVDVAYLIDLVRCTGVFVAVVASCLAAPEATSVSHIGDT